ncbi:MAG TPA: hypothetical protein VFQ00_05495 [Terriglobales bacterium]|nr:hypothetical protein [Terriglobales bacterium]
MSRLLEMIKQSAAPAGVMRSASKGALALPAGEMLEILVYLSNHAVFGEQARMTLAGFDEQGSLTAAADPNTPREVLHYFLAPRNRRPALLLPLFNNRSVSEDILAAVAETASRETTSVLVSSERVMNSTRILKPLLNNSNITPEEYQQITAKLSQLGVNVAEEFGTITDVAVLEWLREHAAELAAEEREGKPFMLMGGVDEDVESEEPSTVTAEALAASKDKGDEERLSTLQKLARMNVGERIKVAMLGSKEERSILIRDGSRLVSSAVLSSPKVSEAEVETFASMKNVRENVLRDIGRSHKFMKSYVVLRNLCSNPRTPLDVSLGLMKNLLAPDLKVLSTNKNIPETLRRMAMKLFKVRSSPSGRGGE